MPQSFSRKVTVALPNPFSSASADIFVIASSQLSPLNSPEFTRIPSVVVKGSAGSAMVSSGSLLAGRITNRISSLYLLANS